MSTASKSLQDTYAPNLACFGCGPANELGLRIKSFVDGDRVVATWHAQKQHEAYPGMLNGGICGALLDCHLNWAAAHHLMVKRGVTVPPCTVTANYSVTLLRPTPSDKPLTITARVVESTDDRVTVEGTIEANGKVTATCKGLFVAVKEGHPAFHRW
jgi:uncharacterized protein (TIGR00369 family)